MRTSKSFERYPEIFFRMKWWLASVLQGEVPTAHFLTLTLPSYYIIETRIQHNTGNKTGGQAVSFGPEIDIKRQAFFLQFFIFVISMTFKICKLS